MQRRKNNGAHQSPLSNSTRSKQDKRRLLPTNDNTAVDSCSNSSLRSNQSDDDNLEQETRMLNKQMTEQEKQEGQKSKLRALYDEGKGVMYCRNVARDIRCAVRDYLVCKVKFVDIANKKTFPSFMLHDFTNSKHFITKLTIHAGLQLRNAMAITLDCLIQSYLRCVSTIHSTSIINIVVSNLHYRRQT